MKTFNPITLILSLCLLGMTWFYVGCGKSRNNADAQSSSTAIATSSRISMPDLLPRNQGIGSFEEQEMMFNTYHDLVRALQVDPTDYRKRIQLAQVFMVEARATGEHGYYYPATLKVLDEILFENPPQDVVFSTLSLKASVMLSLHEFQQAKELAEAAIALNGHNALIYGSLVDANVELGDYDQAVKMADKMVSIRPDLRSYSRISYLREIHGDMEGSIQAMKLAIQAGYPGYEDRAWCRLTLGHLYEEIGQLDSAQTQYEMALVERENYPFARAAMANIYLKREQVQMAENELLLAIETIPEVSFYEQLAKLYQKTGRDAQANKKVEEIMVMLADDEAAGHRMGMEYAKIYLDLKGDMDQAFTYAQAEYKRRPDNIEVNRLMAEILYQQGKPEAAKPYLDVAMRTKSQDPALLCTAGVILSSLDQPQKGRKLIEQSFALNPYQRHSLVGKAKSLVQG
jgi:tetratricopeptide (TPR) repeat protein